MTGDTWQCPRCETHNAAVDTACRQCDRKASGPADTLLIDVAGPTRRAEPVPDFDVHPKYAQAPPRRASKVRVSGAGGVSTVKQAPGQGPSTTRATPVPPPPPVRPVPPPPTRPAAPPPPPRPAPRARPPRAKIPTAAKVVATGVVLFLAGVVFFNGEDSPTPSFATATTTGATGTPCPAAVTRWLGGTSAVLVGAYQSDTHLITLCRTGDGQVHYDGQKKGMPADDKNHISLLAEATTAGFVARNNGWTYEVNGGSSLVLSSPEERGDPVPLRPAP